MTNEAEDRIPLLPSNEPLRGNILNDGHSGTDYLGHSVYAEAIANNIEEVSTPITIGMFAKWGSGKSFILKLVKDILQRKQNQDLAGKNEPQIYSCFCKCSLNTCRWIRVLVTFLIFVLIIATSVFVSTPQVVFSSQEDDSKIIGNNVTSSNTTDQPITNDEHISLHRNILRYSALPIFLFCLLFVCITVCGNSDWWSSEFKANFRLILLAAFTKLPIKFHDKSKQPKKYIFVNFNAWEYTGSDMLWAGIVTNLSNAIEDEFGSVTSRLFRMFEADVTKGDPTDEETRFFAYFPGCNDKSRLKETMKKYGVVSLCTPYQDWEGRKQENNEQSTGWWVVIFSTREEVKQARKSLSAKGIKNRLSDSNFSNHQMDEESAVAEEIDECHQQTLIFKNFWNHPKVTCGIPNLFLWFLAFAFATAVPIVVFFIANEIEVEEDKTKRPVSVAVRVISWLPISFVILYVLFKCSWAMFHSQRKRIMSTLKGAKDTLSAQLGVMDKIKTEVEYITKLVKCAEVTHNQHYKIVIFIDDLDRIALEKVKSVLESVNILLSDESSPFVCLLAVDSRIAVKSIEENKESGLQNSKISGHEYLKKIINLPFCLPEISDEKKKFFLDGLVADANLNRGNQTVSSNIARQTATSIGFSFDPYKIDEKNRKLGSKEFLNESRLFIRDNPWIHRYLHGNPRNIKRIFNVISLTWWLIESYRDQYETSLFFDEIAPLTEPGRVQSNENIIPVKQSEKLAKDLVIWIILTDQWPCRMSYLLQVIEDADKKYNVGEVDDSIEDSKTLFEIYQKYFHPNTEPFKGENLTSLDVHADVLHCFFTELQHTDYNLNKRKANILKQITINLDHCVRQSISGGCTGLLLRGRTINEANFYLVSRIQLKGSQVYPQKKAKHIYYSRPAQLETVQGPKSNKAIYASRMLSLL